MADDELVQDADKATGGDHPPAEVTGQEEATEPVTSDESAPISDDVAALRKEAASHRRKARAAEAERDQLRARVEVLQRSEAQRLAGAALSDPSDMWRAEGVELATMLDDDGAVDPEKVAAVVREVGRQHPNWLQRPTGDADAGKGSSPASPGADDAFGGALRGLAGAA